MKENPSAVQSGHGFLLLYFITVGASSLMDV